MFHRCFGDFHFGLDLVWSYGENSFAHVSVLPSQAKTAYHPDQFHLCLGTEILSLFSSIHYNPMQYAGLEKQAVSKEV